MATITATVQTPLGVGVEGAAIVVGVDETIANKTTDSNGQATWTVDAGYKGGWTIYVLDAAGQHKTGGVMYVQAGSALLFEIN